MAGLWNTGLWDTGLWDGSGDAPVIEVNEAGGSSKGKPKPRFRRPIRPPEPYNQYLRDYLNPPPVPIAEPVIEDDEAATMLLLLN